MIDGAIPTESYSRPAGTDPGRNYRAQFDDQLVQVNPLDSDGFVVAMIGADGRHDPDKDTFKV